MQVVTELPPDNKIAKIFMREQAICFKILSARKSCILPHQAYCYLFLWGCGVAFCLK
jgi:hypothetical protein